MSQIGAVATVIDVLHRKRVRATNGKLRDSALGLRSWDFERVWKASEIASKRSAISFRIG